MPGAFFFVTAEAQELDAADKRALQKSSETEGSVPSLEEASEDEDDEGTRGDGGARVETSG
eukprot:6832128-Karenia_brevis.AAC.1